jgi:hypothetical protein
MRLTLTDIINLIKFLRSSLNRNSEHRNNILSGLHQIEEYIQRSDYQPDKIATTASQIDEALKLWFANTHLSSRDQIEIIIFNRLQERVSKLKTIDEKQSPAAEKQSPKALKPNDAILIYSCHFLSFRYTSHYAIPGKLVLPLHELPGKSSSTQSDRRPPWLYYLALFVLPIFILFLFNARESILNFVQTHRVTIGPSGVKINKEPQAERKDQCPAGDKVFAQYDDIKNRLIGSSEDASFKPIRRYISSLLGSGSDPDINDKSSLNANDLLNIINQQRRTSPTKANNLDQLGRLIPLVSILKNNEAMTKNRQVYQIAVAVPFFADQKYGPLPFGLGVLRGVEQAQKEFLRNTKSKVLLKAIVVNDSIDYPSGSSHTPQQLAHYLAIKGYGGTQFIGLLGHQQTQITKSTANCYKTYGLPVLLTNIQNPTLLTNNHNHERNEYIKTLLPSTTDISNEVVNLLEDRKKGNKDTNGSAQPDMIVFYDKNDSSSKLFMEDLCKKTMDSLPQVCEGVDINAEPLDQKLVRDKRIANKQWFLAFNPFLGKQSKSVTKDELITRNMELAVTIIDEYGKKRPTEEIYVGHEFVDESLKRRMNSILEGKRISIWRFSPWDWRADILKMHKENPVSGRECLNWYAVNSLNSMLLFKHLVENSVSNIPLDQEPNITELRKEISGRLNNDPHLLNDTEPGKLSIKPGESSLIVTPSNIYRVSLTPQSKDSKQSMNRIAQGYCE